MKNLGALIGLIILIFAGVIFWQALSFEIYSNIGPGPGLFPMILSGLLIILSISYIISSLTKDKVIISDVLPKGKSLWQVLRILIAVALFIIISPFLGFSISGFIVLCILFIGEMRWYSAVGISIVTTIAVFITFKTLLGVPLPVNVFGW